MPRFAANLTMLFNEAPFIERFALARAHGFDAVEFLFPYAFPAGQIGEQLDRHGLQLVLHNLHAGDWAAGERGIACDPARRGEFEASVGQAIEYALALGVPRLHCMAGIPPAGLSAAAARASYIDSLRFAARACAPHGIDVLIEPINGLDMPGYLLQSCDDGAAILAEVAEPNLHLQFDIYHVARMQGESEVAPVLARHYPLIRHMQLADAPGRHEPGTGSIDFPALFAQIDALGYEGHIGCEYIPRSGTAAGLGWRNLRAHKD